MILRLYGRHCVEKRHLLTELGSVKSAFCFLQQLGLLDTMATLHPTSGIYQSTMYSIYPANLQYWLSFVVAPVWFKNQHRHMLSINGLDSAIFRRAPPRHCCCLATQLQI